MKVFGSKKTLVMISLPGAMVTEVDWMLVCTGSSILVMSTVFKI